MGLELVDRLKGLEESQQAIPGCLGHIAKGLPGWFRFAAVPEYGFCQVSCSSVMQVAGIVIDGLGQSDTP